MVCYEETALDSKLETFEYKPKLLKCKSFSYFCTNTSKSSSSPRVMNLKCYKLPFTLPSINVYTYVIVYIELLYKKSKQLEMYTFFSGIMDWRKFYTFNYYLMYRITYINTYIQSCESDIIYVIAFPPGINVKYLICDPLSSKPMGSLHWLCVKYL